MSDLGERLELLGAHLLKEKVAELEERLAMANALIELQQQELAMLRQQGGTAMPDPQPLTGAGWQCSCGTWVTNGMFHNCGLTSGYPFQQSSHTISGPAWTMDQNGIMTSQCSSAAGSAASPSTWVQL